MESDTPADILNVLVTNAVEEFERRTGMQIETFRIEWGYFEGKRTVRRCDFVAQNGGALSW